MSNFAILESPLPVDVKAFWLYDRDPAKHGILLPGFLMAFESYPGKLVTAMFRSEGGGTFHDLPLEAYSLRWEGLSQTPIEGACCYSPADVGTPVLEPKLKGPCQVWSKSKTLLGVGEALMAIHWPEGNTLLYLVAFDGRLLLWPPSKLLFGDGTELPDWKKLHHSNLPAPPGNQSSAALWASVRAAKPSAARRQALESNVLGSTASKSE